MDKRILAIILIKYMPRMSKTQNELTKKFLLVRQEGNRSVRRNMSHYNLDMIIAVPIRLPMPSIWIWAEVGTMPGIETKTE